MSGHAGSPRYTAVSRWREEQRSGGRMGSLRTLNLLAFLPLARRVPMYSKPLISLARD